jgi:hypothetical protein
MELVLDDSNEKVQALSKAVRLKKTNFKCCGIAHPPSERRISLCKTLILKLLTPLNE